MTDTETMWAAGLFEGEGSCGVYMAPNRKGAPRVSLGMTDFDVVQRFHAWAGVGSIMSQFKRDGLKGMWVFFTGAQTDVLDVLGRLLPHLGERRFAQVADVILYTADKRDLRRFLCKRGHEFTPDNTYIGKSGSRWCRKCQRMHRRQSRLKARAKAQRTLTFETR